MKRKLQWFSLLYELRVRYFSHHRGEPCSSSCICQKVLPKVMLKMNEGVNKYFENYNVLAIFITKQFIGLRSTYCAKHFLFSISTFFNLLNINNVA